jgi:hypothetical protein
MVIKYTNWPQNRSNAKNIPTYSISKPSKIYPNWDLGFENIPSGNSDSGSTDKNQQTGNYKRFGFI